MVGNQWAVHNYTANFTPILNLTQSFPIGVILESTRNSEKQLTSQPCNIESYISCTGKTPNVYDVYTYMIHTCIL